MTELATAHRAYELGRARVAAGEALAASVPFVLARLIDHPVPLFLVPPFVATIFLLRWRGGRWGRAARYGALASGLLVAAPFVLALVSTSRCPPGCELVCALAGLFSGAALGTMARSGNAIPVLVGAAVAAFGGALGCIGFGAASAIGMSASLAVGLAFGAAHLRAD